MSNSVQPQGWQPIRLLYSWDSPSKNTGVGCHFLLQCMKVKSDSEVPQSCLTLRDPMDCSPRGSPVHGIFQARVLEWGAIVFSDQQVVSEGKMSSAVESPIQVHGSSVFSHSYYHQAGDPGRGGGQLGPLSFPSCCLLPSSNRGGGGKARLRWKGGVSLTGHYNLPL